MKTFDLMPYSDDPGYFWTGFYSARPTLKKLIRDASSLYSAENQLFARKLIRQDTTAKEAKAILLASYELGEKIGTLMHHDAISGTSRKHVVSDY